MRVIEGDVIKFGRVRFKVKKLVVDKADVDSMYEGDDQNDMTSLPNKNYNANAAATNNQNFND